MEVLQLHARASGSVEVWRAQGGDVPYRSCCDHGLALELHFALPLTAIDISESHSTAGDRILAPREECGCLPIKNSVDLPRFPFQGTIG